MKMTKLQKARAYHTAVSDYDVATVEKMVEEGYIQHNPRLPTGRAAFLALFPQLKRHGTKIENLRIFQDGDHVIMQHLWKNASPFGADQKLAFHIIRFGREGLIAEHWSVMTDLMSPLPAGKTLIEGPSKTEELNRTEGNKAQVTDLLRILLKESPEERSTVVTRFFSADARVHHPEMIVRFGGQKNELQTEGPSIRYLKQHKVFGSGNLALSISEGERRGKPVAIYDLFQLENGLIADHWSIDQEIPLTDLANDNTMFGF